MLCTTKLNVTSLSGWHSCTTQIQADQHWRLLKLTGLPGVLRGAYSEQAWTKKRLHASACGPHRLLERALPKPQVKVHQEPPCLGLLMLLKACQHDLDPLDAEIEGGMRT
jgi:hypothetical protein